MRYILADELHCFPPEAIQAELERLGIPYVKLLERIALVLAQNKPLFFREVAPSLPSYWSLHVQGHYPEPVRESLLSALRSPDEAGLGLWERLAPYVLKKATTLAVETIVYERQPWVLSLLRQWSVVGQQLPGADGLEGATEGAKRPMLGMVLEGERLLNKVQLLALSAAQKEAKAGGDLVPFGQLAVRLGFLTPDQLSESLTIQREIAVALDSPKRLGYYLLESGVIAPRQLSEALKAQRDNGDPLGQVLVKQGALDASLLETLLAIQRKERITDYAPGIAV